MTPAGILYDMAGRPLQDGCGEASGLCWMCATPTTHGMPVPKFISSSFVDQNKCLAPGSEYVCSACVWACRWSQPPDMPADPTKNRGGSCLRQWTHLYEGGTYSRFNKGNKPAILAWLRAPKRSPWFAAIADSGQKHVLPWTPLNHGTTRGAIRFETATLRLPDATGWLLVDDMVDALSAGLTKDEIGKGDYRVRNWSQNADVIRQFESTWSGARGSGWWQLALWLAQRREPDESRDGQDRAGAADSRPARGLPAQRGKRARALGAAAHATESGGDEVGHDPGVRDGVHPKPRRDQPEQGLLFRI